MMLKKKMTTISEVAKHAGVSVATVSRVLNNDTLVRPSTADKIRTAIAELNYVPNLPARNLRRSESRVLLILAPNFSNPYYSQIFSGIGDEAKNCGYSVLICKTGNDVQEQISTLQMLQNNRADGAILLANTDDNKWLNELAGNYPIVQCSEYAEHIDLPHVSIDNYQAAYDTIQYLIGLGHRRIGMITNNNGYLSTRLRYEGYCDALKHNGIEPDQSYVAYASGDYSMSSGYSAAKAILSLPNRPTAVFCISDIFALGAISAAEDMQISVPGDFSVVGFDDCDYATIVHPHLTTVAQPCYELGQKSMQIMNDIIHNGSNNASNNSLFLPYRIVERESTAPMIQN